MKKQKITLRTKEELQAQIKPELVKAIQASGITAVRNNPEPMGIGDFLPAVEFALISQKGEAWLISKYEAAVERVGEDNWAVRLGEAHWLAAEVYGESRGSGSFSIPITHRAPAAPAAGASARPTPAPAPAPVTVSPIGLFLALSDKTGLDHEQFAERVAASKVFYAANRSAILAAALSPPTTTLEAQRVLVQAALDCEKNPNEAARLAKASRVLRGL